MTPSAPDLEPVQRRRPRHAGLPMVWQLPHPETRPPTRLEAPLPDDPAAFWEDRSR